MHSWFKGRQEVISLTMFLVNCQVKGKSLKQCKQKVNHVIGASVLCLVTTFIFKKIYLSEGLNTQKGKTICYEMAHCSCCCEAG